ncbi:MAG: hypothetical protein CFH06_01712 [Alphaproteobacteria bacterium MarineAlpha3_Bin5]|nr:hypothetical protein [Magnetovibrio sp.]PPR76562.1 MAG: hypothetical protein CFH06_01712 [Alphaproteobacteria bacterium MarineAlpha3_Bin5]
MTLQKLTVPYSKVIYIVLFLGCLWIPNTVFSTIPNETNNSNPPETAPTLSYDILSVQKALSKLGLYVGPENGRLTGETIAAIKFYQRSKLMEVDGQVTKVLIEKLNYTVNIRKLMKRLDQARKRSISAARSKLLSHPATRNLILSGEEIEIANPIRDATSCFKVPTAFCLLAEARESAKAVGRHELRDWALGEILIAQARAGLGEAAFETTSRIRDPRLIIVALGDIADARAAAGDADAAISAAKLIPDNEKRAKVMISISEIQEKRGDEGDAKKTLQVLLRELVKMHPLVSRIDYLARTAVVFYRTGENKKSMQILHEIELLISKLKKKEYIDSSRRFFASALVQTGDVAGALQILKKIEKESDRIPVFLALSDSYAEKRDWKATIKFANNVKKPRFHAIALGRIAAEQITVSNFAGAASTLKKAIKAVENIKRPYAKSYAVSHLIIESARLFLLGKPDYIHAGSRAIYLATQISDSRLKARALWLMSAYYEEHGHERETRRIMQLARGATLEISSRLSQVWMFSNLANLHAYNGNFEAGWTAFYNGLAVAQNIENSWNRARTLAKLASTMVILVDPGRGVNSVIE